MAAAKGRQLSYYYDYLFKRHTSSSELEDTEGTAAETSCASH